MRPTPPRGRRGPASRSGRDGFGSTENVQGLARGLLYHRRCRFRAPPGADRMRAVGILRRGFPRSTDAICRSRPSAHALLRRHPAKVRRMRDAGGRPVPAKESRSGTFRQPNLPSAVLFAAALASNLAAAQTVPNYGDVYGYFTDDAQYGSWYTPATQLRWRLRRRLLRPALRGRLRQYPVARLPLLGRAVQRHDRPLPLAVRRQLRGHRAGHRTCSPWRKG